MTIEQRVARLEEVTVELQKQKGRLSREGPMQTLRITERTGKDGVLHVRIPLGAPDADFEVVVVVQPAETRSSAASPENRGWPSGYFDLAGSIDDETFVRPPQGELPRPAELD